MHPILERLRSRLQTLEQEHATLAAALAQPEVLRDPDRYARMARRYRELETIVALYRRWQQLRRECADVETLLAQERDPEFRAMAREELQRLQADIDQVERDLVLALLPADPNDARNVILEIRAGTGGEEAALFAADLLRMYQRYCERKGWKCSVLDAHPTDLGGYKEVVCLVEGDGAYRRLKYESGIHRVQRVPVTEASGRIHTSAASVAILPEVDEVDVDIRDEDLRVDVFSASGPGGQHVNKAMTAVRITHLPTGIVVTCQDERSLHQNRRKALRVLRARLYEYYRRKQQQEIAATRRAQVGSGDRSEKIRTYNFPQNRVTDHRIGLTIYRLEDVLDGDLDEIIDALLAHAQAERLKALTQESSVQAAASDA